VPLDREQSLCARHKPPTGGVTAFIPAFVKKEKKPRPKEGKSRPHPRLSKKSSLLLSVSLCHGLPVAASLF
jgi:hypothetical protein